MGLMGGEIGVYLAVEVRGRLRYRRQKNGFDVPESCPRGGGTKEEKAHLTRRLLCRDRKGFCGPLRGNRGKHFGPKREINH